MIKGKERWTWLKLMIFDYCRLLKEIGWRGGGEWLHRVRRGWGGCKWRREGSIKKGTGGGQSEDRVLQKKWTRELIKERTKWETLTQKRAKIMHKNTGSEGFKICQTWFFAKFLQVHLYNCTIVAPFVTFF